MKIVHLFLSLLIITIGVCLTEESFTPGPNESSLPVSLDDSGNLTEHPVYICYSKEQKDLIRSIMMKHVVEGRIGFWEASKIQFAEESEKKRLILALVEKNNLPPLPKCVNATTTTAPPTTTQAPLMSCSDPEYRRIARDSLIEQIKANMSHIIELFDDPQMSLEAIKKAIQIQSLSVIPCEVRKEVDFMSGDDEGDDEDFDDEISNKFIEQIDNCVDKIFSDPDKLDKIRNLLNLTPMTENSRETLRQALIQKVTTGQKVCDFENEPPAAPKVKTETLAQGNSIQGMIGNMTEEEMQEGIRIMNKAIDEGLLPKDIWLKISDGTIDMAWLKKNLTSNRDFILSQLPKKIQEKAKSGELDEKYIELFTSGKTRSQIVSILLEDDDFFLTFFPKILTDALKSDVLPFWLKTTVLEGNKTEKEVKEMMLLNQTLCSELFGETTCAFLVLYDDEANMKMNKAMNYIIYGLLIFIMLSMGLTIEYEKVKELIKRPKGVIIAFIAQFGFMPAAALGLSKAFNLEGFAGLTLLLLGCSPGGNISNLMAYIFDGDMNLSILMTSCSCVLGLGLMPLNIYLWSPMITTPEDSHMEIPYKNISYSIAITLIPVAIGSYIRNCHPQHVGKTKKLGGFMILAQSIAVTVMAIHMFGDILFKYFPTVLLAACAILPLCGYVFGYLFALLFGQSHQKSRTIMIETGCQNSQICVAVLKISFNPIQVGIHFLVPMVYMFLQILELLVMIFFWKACIRRRNSKYSVADNELDSDKQSFKSSKLASSTSSGIQMNEYSDLPSPKKRPCSVLKDIEEVWPLDGTPTKSCLSSFQQAKSENFV